MVTVCEQEKPINIVKGQKKTINAFVTKTAEPLDVSAAVEITAVFVNEDDSTLSLTIGSGVTVVSGQAGKISIELTTAQTALLKEDDEQGFEIVVDFGGGDVQISQKLGLLNVKKRLFV